MKRTISLLLVLCMVLGLLFCLTGCAQVQQEDSVTLYASAEEAAEAAAAKENDNFAISDIIRVPFGYLMDWLYRFCKNYGIAIILFSLIVKLVLLPMGIKSKKSMLKMSRLAPLAKALEAKYGDDKQKYQQELMALYKEEGVSTTGGCLWSFIPLLILLPLYYVIREPLTYMLHNSRSVSAAIVEFVKYNVEIAGGELGGNAAYRQLAVAGQLGPHIESLKNFALTAGANLQQMNFSFLGINLAEIPTFKIWALENVGWAEIGLFMTPLVSGASQVLSMLISNKMNNRVATDANGEVDEEAVQQQKKNNTTMMLLFPLMSLWIGYSMPAAMSVYWIAQGVFGIVQDVILTRHYSKIYDEEDLIRKEKAALKRAEEAEKERLRALRREQNPDGIMDNVSKKKLKQQEKEAADKAAREYEARKRGVTPEEVEENKPLSGDPDRPYCKGRAYVADRYSRKTKENEE